MSCGSLCFCCAGSQRQRSASSSDERVDSSGDDKKQISGKKKSKSPFYSPAETAAAATSRTRQHDVSVKEFDHLICCQVCYQLIFGRALVCKGCPLLCHMKCELKVVTPCNGAVTSSTKKSPGETQALKSSSHKPQQLNGLGTYQSTATSSTERSTGSTKGFAAFFKMNNGNSLLRTGFGPKDPAGAEIEVMYITERMLVLTFPTGGLESVYRSNLKQVSRMLKTKHGDKYKIFNLSKRRHDLCKFNTNVAEFGWPEDLAPPLERLCGICKEIENWLSGDPHNIVVVHSKGGKSRPAVVIAAYMHYTNICASDDQALDRFAMRRFTDDYVGGIAQPSHRRYVMYFSGLLSGAIKINSSAIYLQHIAVLGLPTVDGKSCNPFVKIYEKMVPVHTSGVLYQFNTCALDFRPGKGANRLTFTKDDLDEACYDNRMPSYSRVEMLFSLSPNVLPNGIETVSSTSEMEPQMPRWDSYENFDSTPEDEELETSVSFSDQAEIGHKASETNDDQEECKEKPINSVDENSDLYSSIHKHPPETKNSLDPSSASSVLFTYSNRDHP